MICAILQTTDTHTNTHVFIESLEIVLRYQQQQQQKCVKI